MLLNLCDSRLYLEQAIKVRLFVHFIIIMLLNKYAHFDAIAKDSFAEELLFKIEKNIGIKR